MKKMYDGGILISLFLLLIGSSTLFINNIHYKNNIAKIKFHNEKKIKKLKKIKNIENIKNILKEKEYKNKLNEIQIKYSKQKNHSEMVREKLNYYEELNSRLNKILGNDLKKISEQSSINNKPINN